MAFFNVASLAEKALFLVEISGQISDGMWENARPISHYKFWSSIKPSDIGVDPTNIGIASKFYEGEKCCKRNYNLTDISLISVVGDRMIEELTLYKKYYNMFGDVAFEMDVPTEFHEIELYRDYCNCYGYDSYINRLMKWEKLGINEEFMEQVEKERISIAELIEALDGLKKAMATDQITA